MPRRHPESISTSLELEIRKGFSDNLKLMENLKLWADNSMSEIMLNNSEKHFYSHKSRIKQISSVLLKIKEKRLDQLKKIKSGELKKEHPKWLEIDSFKKAKDMIEDWVGCRMITHTYDAIIELHHEITEYPRFHLQTVTIHDAKEENRKQFKVSDLRREWLEKQGIYYEEKPNSKGYSGIHYIISPNIEESKKCHFFQRFELQIRSLLQETWAEIQHQAIYKGRRMPDSVKEATNESFELLSGMLYQCDQAFSTLIKKHEIWENSSGSRAATSTSPRS